MATFAIPIFFFFSGYLFFKTGKISPDVYLGKIGRRLQSLFIPYILWNLLYLLLAIIVGLFTNRMPILGIPMDQMTFLDGLKAFWNIAWSGGTTIAAPIAVPLWFVRDLMVVMVCAPIVYLVVKWFIILSGKRPIERYLLFIAVVFAFGYWPDITGLNADGWLFFSYGAYFGIRKKEFIVAMKPYALPTFIILVLLIVIEQWWPTTFVYRMEHVVALIFTISFTTNMILAGTFYVKDMGLSISSTFVFAFHYLVLGSIVALIGWGVTSPYSWWLALIIYFLSITLTVFICLLVYWLMRTRLPLTTYILMGGRR